MCSVWVPDVTGGCIQEIVAWLDMAVGRVRAIDNTIYGVRGFQPAAVHIEESEDSMANFVHAVNASLDGYIAEENANFDWTLRS
jgi:hypothetical protein